MSLRTGTMTSIEHSFPELAQAGTLIQSADKLIVGIGSGLSAAGGLNYADPSLARRLFPEYYSLGLRTIAELQGLYWFYGQSEPKKYWGFWARHINHMRYAAGATQPYLELFRLIGNKDYFICTTNVDSQVNKAGFSEERIFAMQGNYCYFQCIQPCTDQVYYNQEMIERMVGHMPTPFEIRKEDVPKCPRCGRPLVPNLRCDNSFVETPHLKNMSAYEQFIRACTDKNTVLLELGVGYNTPVLIRYPFEKITAGYPKSHLIRINNSCAKVPDEIQGRSLSICCDLKEALVQLNKFYPENLENFTKGTFR